MIHDYLRRWRCKANISQAEAARRFGWSPAFQSAIEKGRRPVNLGHVSRLAKEYRIGAVDVGAAILSIQEAA